jgi:hypothetical protein
MRREGRLFPPEQSYKVAQVVIDVVHPCKKILADVQLNGGAFDGAIRCR